MRNALFIRIIAGVPVMYICGSCIEGKRAGVKTRAITEPLHWIQEIRLREIMGELESLSVESWPQQIEAEYSQAAQYREAQALWEARQLADGLARAAVQIPQAISQVSMAEVDRRSFLGQVETLEKQATRLRDAAALGDQAEMRRVLDSIDATCNSCHERFRDISGPRVRESSAGR